MANELKLVISAQDGAADVLEKIGAALVSTAADAKKADAGMEGAGKATEEAGSAAAESKQDFNALQQMFAVLVGKLDKYADSAEAAKKDQNALAGSATELNSKFELLGKGLGALQGLLGGAGERFTRLAEQGDESAQTLLGGFAKAEHSVDKLYGVLVKSLLPTFVPLIEYVVELVDAASSWVEENKVVETTIGTLVQSMGYLAKGVGVLVTGIDPLVSTWSKGWGLIIGTVQRGIAWILDNFEKFSKTLIQNAAVFVQVFDQDVADSMFRASDRIKQISKDLKKSASEWESVSLSTETAGQVILDAGDRMLEFGAKTKAGMATASTSLAMFSEQAFAQAKVQLEKELAAVAENKQAELALLQAFYEQWKGVATVKREEILALETQIAAKDREIQITELESGLARELALAGESAALRHEVWRNHFDEIAVLYGESGARTLEAQAEMQLLEEENLVQFLDLKRMLHEGFLAFQEEMGARRFELVQQELEQLAEQGASEEEILQARIEKWQALADSVVLSGERRKQAEQEVTTTTQALHKLQIKSAVETAQAQFEAAKKLASALIETTGSMKDRMLAFYREMASGIIQTMTSQATIAVELATKQALGVATAADKERLAALGPIGALVAKAHAHLPFPIGPALAAAALVAFQALANKVLGSAKGFQDGGSVSGSGSGDRIPALLEPGEFVLRRSAAQAAGREFLEGLNETGNVARASAAAGAGAGTAGQVSTIRLELVIRSDGDELIDAIARGLSVAVTSRDVRLEASSIFDPVAA